MKLIWKEIMGKSRPLWRAKGLRAKYAIIREGANRYDAIATMGRHVVDKQFGSLLAAKSGAQKLESSMSR